MGSIPTVIRVCKTKDDIALNAMSAGWMNEFVEAGVGSVSSFLFRLVSLE
ncbi:MAG: hypothetical protein IPP29_13290 [Bacteroidetes bacterium]|nr:hypothetical protein [Bacteroidota bacterium]